MQTSRHDPVVLHLAGRIDAGRQFRRSLRNDEALDIHALTERSSALTRHYVGVESGTSRDQRESFAEPMHSEGTMVRNAGP